jgi:predicted dinucleotide-binding enzyme
MACAGETLDRVALPISGDNPKAKEIVAQLIDRIGFDSVDAGTIAESWRQQPGAPVYCTNPTNGSAVKRTPAPTDQTHLRGDVDD